MPHHKPGELTKSYTVSLDVLCSAWVEEQAKLANVAAGSWLRVFVEKCIAEKLKP